MGSISTQANFIRNTLRNDHFIAELAEQMNAIDLA
jgi:hypothetical protein